MLLRTEGSSSTTKTIGAVTALAIDATITNPDERSSAMPVFSADRVACEHIAKAVSPCATKVQ
jgi:hypothetical protein